MKIRSDTLPAYVRIRQQVLGQIARVDGEYEKLPSVQELCDIHQASRPTVIKALRQLREDGLIIARRGLGMFANPRALDKRYGRDVGKPKGVVGLLASMGTHSYYATYNLNLLNGLSSVLANGGYHLQFVNLVHQGADALDELRLLKLNGLLWLWTGDAALPTINAIDASDIPLVTVAHHEKYYSKNFVGMSFRDNGHFSAEHLLELGHRDIVYLCLPGHNCGGLELEGMRAAFIDRGLAPELLRVIPCGDDPTAKLEALFDLRIPFTAVISPTEYYHQLMDILAQHGVDVPGDCSVITNEELLTQSLKEPTPSRTAYPLVEMGAAAAAGLIDIMEGRRKAPLNMVVNCHFIDGETCAPLKRV